MESPLDRTLRNLHEFAGSGMLAQELAAAREEYFERTGTVMKGEPVEELRLASFVEWFILDRRLASTGRTPLEEYMRLRADLLEPEEASLLQSLARNIHSVFAVKKRKSDRVDLKDLYTGDVYKEVRRVPVTLTKGDTVELRLVLIQDEVWATDTLCFHPFAAAKTIKKIFKQAKKEGRALADAVMDLVALNTRYEHLPKGARNSAYEIK